MADELMHFGVKGMKWGVLRYQNEDGTLTTLGKKRAQFKSDDKKASQSGTKADEAQAAYSYREFKDAKTRLKIENQKSKSKRQLALEQEYQKKGFTKDEAEIKAYNRAKTETVLKVAGGIALASAAAYVVRFAETGKVIPEEVLAERQEKRDRINELQEQIRRRYECC